MFVCVCARVRESEVRTVIRCGARSEESIGDACGAGTKCGTCVERIHALINEESAVDTLVAAHRP